MSEFCRFVRLFRAVGPAGKGVVRGILRPESRGINFETSHLAKVCGMAVVHVQKG